MQQQVDELRDRDLKRHQAETAQWIRLCQQVHQEKAVIIPAPPERLSPQDLERLVKPSQMMVVPRRIDLSALTRHEYSPCEILELEQRMNRLAARGWRNGRI